jgi:DNA-binding protein YbaB
MDAGGFGFARVDALSGELDRLLSASGQIRDRLDGVSQTVVSDDGHVEVSADARGRLVDLRIDPRVFRSPDADELAAVVVSCAAEAARRVDEQLVDILTEYLPRGADAREFLNLPDDRPADAAAGQAGYPGGFDGRR